MDNAQEKHSEESTAAACCQVDEFIGRLASENPDLRMFTTFCLQKGLDVQTIATGGISWEEAQVFVIAMISTVSSILRLSPEETERFTAEVHEYVRRNLPELVLAHGPLS